MGGPGRAMSPHSGAGGQEQDQVRAGGGGGRGLAPAMAGDGRPGEEEPRTRGHWDQDH